MKKRRKEKRFLAVASAVSVLLIATTAFAAANTISGYESVKKAGFNLLQAENYTAEMSIEVKVDGEIVNSERRSIKLEDALNSSFSGSTLFNGMEMENEGYVQDGKTIYPTEGGYSVYDFNSRSLISTSRITENEYKLANVLLDTLTGDVKNHFYNNNGIITLDLDRNQIPELVQLALSVSTETVKRNYNYTGEELIPVPVENAFVESVSAEMKVDENGNFETVKAHGIMTGTDIDGINRTYEVILNAKVWDVGTTVSDKIDLDNVNIIRPWSNYEWYYDDMDIEVFNGGDIIIDTNNVDSIMKANEYLLVNPDNELRDQ